MQRARYRIILAAALVAAFLVLATTASADVIRPTCAGSVVLDKYYDIASNIYLVNLTCPEAKKILKGPASKRGYKCVKFKDQGSDGWYLCTKASKVIVFRLSTT